MHSLGICRHTSFAVIGFGKCSGQHAKLAAAHYKNKQIRTFAECEIVVWCGVVWCGVVWCGVVWCGVVWCGVVWCGVVWCGVGCPPPPPPPPPPLTFEAVGQIKKIMIPGAPIIKFFNLANCFESYLWGGGLQHNPLFCKSVHK